jgi:response regulator RpfG family c-di-GMP phosphodiesterase
MLNRSHVRLLVVDDERYICDLVTETLTGEQYEVVSFTDPAQALAYLSNNEVDLVLSDLVMGSFSGIQILERTLGSHPEAIVILMTAHPTVQMAISVLKNGAYDLLVKPFKLEVLRAAIRRGLAHQQIKRENLTLRGQVEFLKAAGAMNTGVDINRTLQMVVASCKTELGAMAASIMEVDPKSGAISRTVHEITNPDFRDLVLDDATIVRFENGSITEPVIASEKIEYQGEELLRTAISSPIYIRGTLHGVINLVTLSRFRRLTQGQLDVLTILTSAAGSAIENHRLYQNVQSSYWSAIRALANAIEARDGCTAGHTDRVIRLAEPMAQALGWPESKMHALRLGCTLHDIGKIGVPDSILNKPNRLSPEELVHMQHHPQVGARIIKDIDLFRPALPYILSHHERYDGGGYPKGLVGNDIPVEGRLLAVVDTFDAIMSDRPYRKGAPLGIAVKELLGNRGKQFDPQMVDLFIKLLRARMIDLLDLYGREEDLADIDELTGFTSAEESAQTTVSVLSTR